MAKIRARHEVRRVADRASYDRADAYAMLDAAWMAHVGFAVDGQPFVIPMLYAREGDTLLLHGSIASRLMTTLGAGVPCCVTVTHVDGIVLARSHFHHSVNYRSVVVFGTATVVDDPVEKAAAFHRFVDSIIPGRAADTRAADAQEMAATSLLRLAIEDISAKRRDGGPKDHPDDLSSRAWAGVLPMAVTYAAPVPAEDLPAGIAVPDYVAARASS